MKSTMYTTDGGSALSELAEHSGWQRLDPPTEDQEWSDASIIGNWQGSPVRVGFKIKTVEDNDRCLHNVFRTSKYNVHLKIESLGQGLAQGQVKVEEADGYTEQ